MRRTREVVLSIIGMVTYFFIGIMGIILMILWDSEAFMEKIQGDSDMSSADVNWAIDLFSGYSWIILVASILSIIAGIIAVVFLRGNKRPIEAGIILLVTAVSGGILIFPFGLFSGLFYLIAGNMCLARKPKQL